jgi:cytochrome c oxidase subunit 2
MSALPPQASSFAAPIDHLFGVIHIVSAAAFAIVEGLLIYAIVRYRKKPNVRASYFHGRPSLEIAWAVVPAGILLWLAFASRDLWARVRYEQSYPADAEHIEVVAQQFAWNVRYPGADANFGKTEAGQVTDQNPFGRVGSDVNGKDDVITLNEMHLVLGKPVRLTLRSRDVIHSFFVPEFRFKQDAVPGSAIEVWFTPTRAGKYEIACAEFCGPAHYRMRGYLTVGTEAEHAAWLKEQLSY